MDIKNEFILFLEEKNLKQQAKEFDQFFDCSLDEKYDTSIMRLLTDISLKYEFAKWIVEKVVNDKSAVFVDFVDARLYSMVLYHAWKVILNADVNAMDKEEACRILYYSTHIEGLRIETGCYLKGYVIHTANNYAPVSMRPGRCIHPGYRLFVVNMLCFRYKRVVIGCRSDSGPILSTSYHKGCTPIGIKEDSRGRKWNLMELNADLTDDNFAIFSNAIDGDGTIEICDWVNNYNVSVIYRSGI